VRNNILINLRMLVCFYSLRPIRQTSGALKNRIMDEEKERPQYYSEAEYGAQQQETPKESLRDPKEILEIGQPQTNYFAI